VIWDGSCGQITEDQKALMVELYERDRSDLVKLRTFLGSNHTIGDAPAGNYGGYRFFAG